MGARYLDTTREAIITRQEPAGANTAKDLMECGLLFVRTGNRSIVRKGMRMLIEAAFEYKMTPEDAVLLAVARTQFIQKVDEKVGNDEHI